MHCLTLPLLVALAAIAPVTARAALLVHEPFNYPADSAFPDYSGGQLETSFHPASLGGTGLSPQPRPSRDRSTFTIAKAGLSYKDSKGRSLRTSGLSAIVPQGASSVFTLYTTWADDPFAALRNPSEPREINKAGETVWLSFLVRAESEPAPGDSFSLRFSGTKTSLPIGLHTRRSSGVPTLGAISSSGSTPVQAGKTHLIVLRLVLGDAGEVDMWVDPDLGGKRPSSAPDPQLRNVSIYLRSLWFTKNTNSELAVTFDELRIGETYADVAPTL